MSWKGLWNKSRTLATQVGMTQKWLKAQSVMAIPERVVADKEMWVNIHYPAMAR